MTKQKTYILVEITHNTPIKKNVALDLPGRISRAACEAILARGGDCVDAKAKIVERPEKTFVI